MAGEIKHVSVGAQLTQAEYEQVDGHTLDSMAQGDLIRAASATAGDLTRLAIGAANTVLTTDGTDPSWATIVNANVSASAAIVASKIAAGTFGAGAYSMAGSTFDDLFLTAGGVINFDNGDVTLTHAANTLVFAGASTGYTFDAVVAPAPNDGAALGVATTNMWSDLFLASGAVINFNAGNVTLTHTAGQIALEGALKLADGGTVTQDTGITTAVTLNTICGQITTVTAPAIAAGAEAIFTVSNTKVAAIDTIIVNVQSQFTDGECIAFVRGVTAGAFDIELSNVGAAAVSAGAAVINFAVIKCSAT